MLKITVIICLGLFTAGIRAGQEEIIMTILLVSPGRAPRKITIDDTLDAIQRTVGSSIQAVYPFEELVALNCHEEGKLLHLPLNRALRSPATGEIYDTLLGTSSSAPRRRTVSTSKALQTTNWRGTPKSSAPRRCFSPVPAAVS